MKKGMETSTLDGTTKFKDQKLPRPYDLNSHLNNFLPGLDKISPHHAFPIMIPIPSNDAKILGLKIPEESSSTRKASESSSKTTSGSKETQKIIIDKTVENPRSFHATVECGLKVLANRNARSANVSNIQPNKKLLASILGNAGGTITIGRLKQKSRKCTNESDTSDRLSQETNSKSIKQLFSVADSWSSDSVMSLSDDCTCCHAANTCPLHTQSKSNINP